MSLMPSKIMTKQSYSVKDDDGDIHWYKGSVRHREDGPAVEYADGSEVWLYNGVIHRTDGPAIMWKDGGRFWYLDGVQYNCMEWLLEVDKWEKNKS